MPFGIKFEGAVELEYPLGVVVDRHPDQELLAGCSPRPA